jgi:hypothetical protein
MRLMKVDGQLSSVLGRSIDLELRRPRQPRRAAIRHLSYRLWRALCPVTFHLSSARSVTHFSACSPLWEKRFAVAILTHKYVSYPLRPALATAGWPPREDLRCIAPELSRTISFDSPCLTVHHKGERSHGWSGAS